MRLTFLILSDNFVLARNVIIKDPCPRRMGGDGKVFNGGFMATNKSMAQMTQKHSIHGDSKTEKLAAKILPILVRQAKAKKTITYKALAREVGTHHRVIGRALGIIGNELSKMEGPPPLINACVVKQDTGEPSGGVDEFMEQRLNEIKKTERLLAIRLLQEESFNYTKWNEVLKKLELKPSVGVLIDDTAHKYSGGGGEGPEHKEFKDYVRNHPERLHLSKDMTSSFEYDLKSGDRLDVVFENDEMIVGVEVKSKISLPEDIQRGLFQTVKYQAVLTAMEDVAPKKKEVKVFLVLEKTLPAELIWVQNTLGVEVIESFRETGL